MIQATKNGSKCQKYYHDIFSKHIGAIQKQIIEKKENSFLPLLMNIQVEDT